jgi:hypothetical protein
LGGTSVKTWGFMLAKQTFHCLSLTSSLFWSGYFGDGVSQTVCWGWPWSVILPIWTSQVARITGVSHWCPTFIQLLNMTLFCTISSFLCHRQFCSFLWRWCYPPNLHWDSIVELHGDRDNCPTSLALGRFSRSPVLIKNKDTIISPITKHHHSKNPGPALGSSSNFTSQNGIIIAYLLLKPNSSCILLPGHQPKISNSLWISYYGCVTSHHKTMA